ncbi:transmembrane and immunoglobulin domain-containing protein 1 [Erpetoichthys calabaricus]|uniref:transmembrane and immunoglobulin domain-containing protein 1 n=1 Tax=Erpetoichthys calabaricus TaxID=27687 RepID=UPI002234C63F|nr:transmembrane and immunoglobulin domain-containing protein 1 [Erpetoichthys calabaricus]
MAKNLIFITLLSTLVLRLEGVKVVVNEGFHEGQITINKSEALSLSCKVENTEEEEWLEWYREKDMVSLNANNQKNSSRLCVYPVTESDNQVTFTCCLKRHTEINASVVLNVQFATTLSGEENVTGERGREISFNCDIWANPQVKVHWFKDEESIDLITGSYQLYQDGKQARMTIPKVMDSHKASYKCLAISEVHGNATRIFHLTVKGDKTYTITMEPIIAAVVVVVLTLILGIISRRERIMAMFCKCNEVPLSNQ